ncbi:hypothetical protein VitviT2T_011247 [Vitis vinifera]|uniref:Reverse transcriptase domain-containing protein n=1 Tax=Vitis vinifera TaxID=29760 RepID=A0ABY9CAG3_VITVI|nr:hypothetical protein VitviT2T_011247 [Vitis vinifera]
MHMIKTGPHRTGTISICLLMNILGLIFSPYLFLFAMEALSQLLSCARNGGFISGFRVGGRGREGLIVSHLLFGDDTLIFCDAEADQLQYLSWTFMWFEAISGLKVNLSKTEAFPVGEGILMETLASVLGCKIGSLPTTYLGLPLGASYKSTRVWDIVEERFRKMLSFWKRQYLSKGGQPSYLVKKHPLQPPNLLPFPICDP